ncbi:MAG: haloacid dehalogenase type II [Pseudomonadota bacterium]
MKLADFDALTFDCYGTLIDWESGMVRGLAPLVDAVGGLTRDEVLNAHAEEESGQQARTPHMRYSDLLAIVYKRLAERWGRPASREDCVAYGQSVKDWPAFPDSAEALRSLKERYKLVILSNVDNDSFTGSNARLGVEFDAIITAEDVGSYKPADANFETMVSALGRMGIGKSRILHVAESLFHDHVPAKRHGLSNVWIHRRHAVGGFGATMPVADQPEVDWRFASMAEFASAAAAA